jgi:MFS family permease
MSRRPELYRYYVLGVLSAICVLNYYDRSVVEIILQPMKQELGLTDTQAGLLSGMAFAAVYSLLGLPIARIADRGIRVRVLSAALALWSLMSVACGLATNAVALFWARMGVGAGEAGGFPTTQAIIAEYFPPEKRAKALSAIAIASSVGMVSGLTVGGFVSGHFGWRAAFWVGGAPGLLLAGLTLYSVREPGAWLLDLNSGSRKLAPVPVGTALKQLWRRSAYALTVAGMTVAMIGAYGLETWTPTFVIRSYGLNPGQVGLLFGLVSAVPAIAGMFIGGVLHERWNNRDKRAPLWILCICFAVAVPAGLVTFLAPHLYLAVAAILVSSLVGAAYIGPSYALIQGLAGPKLRATGAAIYMAVVNLVALSTGPAVVGFLSDHLARAAGVDSLRYALCAVCLVYVGSLPLFLLAARTVEADLDGAERETDGVPNVIASTAKRQPARP